MLDYSKDKVDNEWRRNFLVEQVKSICCETQEQVLENVLSLFCTIEDEDIATYVVERLSQEELNLLVYSLLTNFSEPKRRTYSCLMAVNAEKKKVAWLLEKVLMEEREARC
tara:strand:- start:3268 stop:3600 length:333 start_codon:yes stop_codon:yes gene_type:complete